MTTLYNWELIHNELEGKKEYISTLIKQIESYIKNELSKQYTGIDIGLVYNKLEEDIENNNEFMIFIDRSSGMYIDHKFIKLSDIGIVYDYKMPYLESINKK